MIMWEFFVVNLSSQRKVVKIVCIAEESRPGFIALQVGGGGSSILPGLFLNSIVIMNALINNPSSFH